MIDSKRRWQGCTHLRHMGWEGYPLPQKKESLLGIATPYESHGIC